MDSVLEKLASLAVDESTKLVGLRKQVQFLHRELSSMHAAIKDIADMDDPDNGTKEWRNQVTQLAYDTEDCIDDFRHRVEGPHDGQGLMRKVGRLLKTLMDRYQISRKITEIKTRVQEVSERHTRYMLDGFESRSAHVSVDPRINAFYAETSSLVGIDGPKEEVIRLLTQVDDASMQELRVVSIVGFGGLGKTTLANEVYRELTGSFTCKAIISVSQRPEMTSLLRSLFSKVSGERAEHINDIKDLIDNIREYLQGKRYLIVVDDLWDESVWKIIKCAFPESHCGSRVLTTTRIENVAATSSNGQWKFVYKMKPLDDYHSGQLFLGRAFGSEDKCPEQFEEPYEKILQKCGGLPLAIITIASLLACQPTRSLEQWGYVLKSLRHNMRLDPTLEGMSQILNLSYTHLPHALKLCLLYFGMYPEDYETDREELVFQWVAEGFISGVVGRDVTEVAGSYLNELVNRSMIIPCEDIYENKIRYRVHDMVLNLILSKSAEENFLCAVQNLQEISSRQQQHKARRLSLQFRDKSQVESAACTLPHVRSLLIFGQTLSLGLLGLKFLRVLYIDHATDNLDHTLISKLFQLKYLFVQFEQLVLPKEIGGLRNLETLYVF